MSYTELHFHLLPGIDDGPATIEDSLALARAAVADGTGRIVATPHVHPLHVTDPSELAVRVAELNDRLRIPLEVMAGGELCHEMVGRLSHSQLDAIAQGPPGRRWILLEAPFDGLGPGFTEAADELRARGFATLIAHPERAAQTPNTAAALQHEFAAGSYVQLTAWSFSGEYGEHVRTLAVRLLLSAPNVIVASDAHGAVRPPALSPALEALAEVGVRDPERFVDAIPRRLLDDGILARRAKLAA
jgi:protein-tyrosine phosphatase